MGHLNIQHPETKLWRCYSTIVDDWLCGWMPENDYKEWLIQDTIDSMREEFERIGIKSSTRYSYNELVYDAACTKWKNAHCNSCIEIECDNCFIYTNDWESYAKNYEDNDILGIISELVIPKDEKPYLSEGA